MAEEEEEQEDQDVRNKFLGSLEFLAIKNGSNSNCSIALICDTYVHYK